MAKCDEDGWDVVSASRLWTCPGCGVSSPFEDWSETCVQCDCCGDHEARQCPACEQVYDCVWGSEKIEAENQKKKMEKSA